MVGRCAEEGGGGGVEAIALHDLGVHGGKRWSLEGLAQGRNLPQDASRRPYVGRAVIRPALRSRAASSAGELYTIFVQSAHTVMAFAKDEISASDPPAFSVHYWKHNHFRLPPADICNLIVTSYKASMHSHCGHTRHCGSW